MQETSVDRHRTALNMLDNNSACVLRPEPHISSSTCARPSAKRPIVGKTPALACGTNIGGHPMAMSRRRLYKGTRRTPLAHDNDVQPTPPRGLQLLCQPSAQAQRAANESTSTHRLVQPMDLFDKRCESGRNLAASVNACIARYNNMLRQSRTKRVVIARRRAT